MADRYFTTNLPSIPKKKIFFDANVIIYIFWPVPTSAFWTKNSSTTFSYLLKNDFEMVTDFNSLSEVVNRILKIEFNNYLNALPPSKRTLKFKIFRNSSDGQSVLNDVYTIIKENVLERINIVGKSFSKEDLFSFLESDTLDFGDKGIVSTCITHNCILFTQDIDFKEIDLDILTSNNSYR